MFEFLTDKFSAAFSYISGQKKFTEKNIEIVVEKIKDALLDADVPYSTVNAFIDAVHKEVMGTQIFKTLKPDEQFAKIVHDKLISFLGSDNNFSFNVPRIFLVNGLQGSGKTTTIAKIVHCFSAQHKKKINALIGSVDFYRPAAITQLQILAQQVGAEFYMPPSIDPLKEARAFKSLAFSKEYDLVILDTAGRLHVDDYMLDELKKIKEIFNAGQTILVLDAMTGQESLNVARTFEQKIGFDGVVLTKMDSNTRAGAAFAFRYELKKPIWFVGTGERIDDLELFRGERLANRLMGMGDLETLVEHAERKIEKSEAQSFENSLNKGQINLEDFVQQLRAMRKLGPLSQLMRYMPGMPKEAFSHEKVSQSEKEMAKFVAIVDSMTRKERQNYRLINGSRRQRIAKGAGVNSTDVSLLLERFEQFAKLLQYMGGGKNIFSKRL